VVAGIILLCFAYVLSQFFRSFLAVLTGVLSADLGVTPNDLATSSALWFLSFSIMQIPVGAGLDKLGPRGMAAGLFFVGGAGGALVFAYATTSWHLHMAMVLIGIGCSPVLMAAYYIFARVYSPKVFASLAAVMIGVGSLGNLAGSVPLAWVVDVLGWRGALTGLAIVSAIVSCGILLFVKNPHTVPSQEQGGFIDLLRLPALWLILPLMFVHYAPVIGLRGLWIGPYLGDTFNASQSQIATASMIMSIAMIIGTFAYGPMDRWFGTRKWVVFTGNFVSFCAIAVLWQMGYHSYPLAVAAFSIIGFFGMAYPVMVAHGRSFVLPHLTGRGVTLMNMFGIGGVGLFQYVTGNLQKSAVAMGHQGAEIYHSLLVFYLVTLAVSLGIYLFAQDRID
jgi:predicted MFS family arabinose efflux permease